MDNEGGIGTYRSPNESPDRVKEEERGQVIGQNPKAEVAPFLSAEIGIKNSVFWIEVAVRGWGSDAKLRAKKQSRVSGQQLAGLGLENTLRTNPLKS